jgi:hypothetical protein
MDVNCLIDGIDFDGRPAAGMLRWPVAIERRPPRNGNLNPADPAPGGRYRFTPARRC